MASGIEVEVNKGKLRSSMMLGSKQLEAIWTQDITDVAYSYSELDTGGQGYVAFCCLVMQSNACRTEHVSNKQFHQSKQLGDLRRAHSIFGKPIAIYST